jgi:hypothetical protein
MVSILFFVTVFVVMFRVTKHGKGRDKGLVVSEDVSVYQLLITGKNNITFASYGKSDVSEIWACRTRLTLHTSSLELTLLLLP